MHTINSKILCVIFSLTLFACGGGGGNENDEDSNTTEPIFDKPITDFKYEELPDNRKQEWEEYYSAATTLLFDSMEGVYNVSTESEVGVDVTFLHIAREVRDDKSVLVARAYNFMLDQVDHEGNCYRLASGNDTNSLVNVNGGSVLEWVEPWVTSDDSSTFSIDFAPLGDKLTWHFDINQNHVKLTYGDLISGKSVIVNSGELKLSAKLHKVDFNDTTFESIIANMCEGIPLEKSEISNNFKGLYDISFTDEQGKFFEGYLNFDQEGILGAYKYMGDGYDVVSNQNCYAFSNSFNSHISGMKPVYLPESNQLMIRANGRKYSWNLDSAGFVSSVSVDDGAPLDALVNEDDLISISKYPAEITLDYINEMKCQ